MATSLKIDEALESRVRRLAAQRRRSAHGIMLEAIADYVQREEARDSFKQEAIAAWAEYQRTGQHLTGDETRVWLESWGSDEEAAAPPCHG